MNDPYLYPGTNTLKNRFDVKNPQKLQELESAYCYLRLNQPFPPEILIMNILKPYINTCLVMYTPGRGKKGL